MILTTQIPLNDIEIEPTSHQKCISGKCSGVSKKIARKQLEKIALNYMRYEINKKGVLDGYVEMFPDIAGATLKIEL